MDSASLLEMARRMPTHWCFRCGTVQIPAQPKQPFALQLVVHKPIADVGDRDVGSQRGLHFLVFLAGRALRRRIRMRLKITRGWGSSRPSMRMPGL